MKREIILLPTSTAPGFPTPRTTAVFPGTSGYINANTPSLRLDEAWADELNTSHFAENNNFTPANPSTSYAQVGFPAAPTLVTFTNIILSWAWDYGQGGANSWWFPADNSQGPTLTPFILERDGTTRSYGTPTEITGADIAGMNVNFNTEPGVFKLKSETWDFSGIHPEGGPWTIDDINNLVAGVRLQCWDGPNGKPFDPTGFERCRMVSFKATLSVTDLGGFVDNVRSAASTSLRLMRRARNAVVPSLKANLAIGDVGSRVYMSHPKGPSVGGKGWGQRVLERRPGLILSRRILPESFRVEDEIFDLRQYTCLAWAAYRIDGGWSPELQGLSLVDKGAGYTHVRAQDGWSPRPGDGVVMRVIDNYPNLSFQGLAASGGGDLTVANRNYDLMASGWSTVGSSGSFSAAADTTVYAAEEQGFLSSALLDYGSGGGQGGRERTLGTLPFADGDFLHVRIVVKNTSVPTPASQNAEWSLRRENGGLAAPEYWDNATRTWTTSVTYNDIPSDTPSGEVVVDAIPLDAGGASSDPDYYIRVGRFSANLSSVQFNVGLVDCFHSDNTVAGCRPSIVTLDAGITRVADVHRMVNATGTGQVWDYTRGVAVVEVQPFWRAEDLPTNQVQPLIHAFHAAATYDALQFIAKTGSDDFIRFERAVSGQATFTLDVDIPSVDLTRLHVLRAWARWLGADGWTDYAPFSVEVGYAIFLEADGSLVSTGSEIGTLVYQADVATRDWVGIGNDSTRFLDGYVRMWETRRNPISGLEAIWRI